MQSTELSPVLLVHGAHRGRRGARSWRASRERGVVLFVCLILLLVLTVLGVSLARQQTVEERLATNEFNHEIALQAAQAVLQAAYDDAGTSLAGASYTNGTTGMATLTQELGQMPPYGTPLDRSADWANPGTNTIEYSQGPGYGPPLTGVPAAAQPQFVIEDLPPILRSGQAGGNVDNYQSGGANVHVRRITAHANGADGSASATVQIIRFVGG